MMMRNATMMAFKPMNGREWLIMVSSGWQKLTIFDHDWQWSKMLIIGGKNTQRQPLMLRSFPWENPSTMCNNAELWQFKRQCLISLDHQYGSMMVNCLANNWSTVLKNHRLIFEITWSIEININHNHTAPIIKSLKKTIHIHLLHPDSSMLLLADTAVSSKSCGTAPQNRPFLRTQWHPLLRRFPGDGSGEDPRGSWWAVQWWLIVYDWWCYWACATTKYL